MHVFFLWRVRDRIARGDPDFTVFYTAGKILREGKGSQLYDPYTQQAVQREFTANDDIRRGPLPYIHPPFEALVFLPLTFFSYPVAFALWGVMNVGMLAGIMFVLRDSVDLLRRVSTVELVLWSLAFFPVFATFHQGQDAILLLLVLALGFRALNVGAAFRAGCWLGFGVFKYHLILPVILILVIWNGRKLLFGFLTTGACLAFMSLALVGWNAALQYPVYALRIVSNAGFGGIPLRQLPNLLGLLAGWNFLGEAGWMVQGLVLACAAALLIVVGRLRRQSQDANLANLCGACAVISALLVGYNTNTYDLSLLVLSLVLVADYWWREFSKKRKTNLSLILPAAPLLISPLWFFLWLRWERINLIAIFLVWWVYAIRKEILRATANAETRPGLRVAL
jgi:hypothetical protein